MKAHPERQSFRDFQALNFGLPVKCEQGDGLLDIMRKSIAGTLTNMRVTVVGCEQHTTPPFQVQGSVTQQAVISLILVISSYNSLSCFCLLTSTPGPSQACSQSQVWDMYHGAQCSLAAARSPAGLEVVCREAVHCRVHLAIRTTRWPPEIHNQRHVLKSSRFTSSRPAMNATRQISDLTCRRPLCWAGKVSLPTHADSRCHDKRMHVGPYLVRIRQ